MKKRFFINWQTSVAGICTGLPVLIQGSLTKNPEQIISGVGAILLGIFSKDFNK